MSATDPRLVSTLEIKCMQLTLTAAAKQTATLVVPDAWVPAK